MTPVLPDPVRCTTMEAVLVIAACLFALIALDIAAVAFGVDSREGFTDDDPRRGLS
jgi:hypothetical protein